LEILALLLLGRLTDRVPGTLLVMFGALAGMIYNLAMAGLQGPVLLIGVQVLNALFVAGVAGVGLTLFQGVVLRPGLASGLFMNTTRIGAILSGLLISVAGFPGLGYPAVFVAGAAVTAVGAVLVWLAGRLRRPPAAHLHGAESAA
jgi:MFS transporter, SET family, sugar efflux transporter